MRRIQLYLDEDLDEAIGRRAVDRGVPRSVVIREALRTALPGLHETKDDPSLRLIGAYEGDEGEVATIDDVVYRQ